MIKRYGCLQVCLNILRAGLIASRIDLTTELYPGVLAAPLIIGSIAGTGGRFSIDPILGGFGALEGGVLGNLLAFADLTFACSHQLHSLPPTAANESLL